MIPLTKEKKLQRWCLLVVLIFVTAVRGGRDIECHDQQSSAGNPLILRFPQPSEDTWESHPPSKPTLWFKPQASFVKDKEILWKFGQMDSSGDVSNEFELQLKRGNKYLIYTFKKTEGRKQYLESRIAPEWFSAQNWTRFTLGDSKFSIQFGKEVDQTLDIQLNGLEIGTVEAVKSNSNPEVFASVNCTVPAEDGPTTMTTSLVTIPSTSTEAVTKLITEATNATDDLETSTIGEVEGYTDVIYSEVTDSNSTQGPSEDVDEPVPVREEEECTRVPFWAWVCIGIMFAFIILFFLLLVYVIILLRSNNDPTASDTNYGEHGRLNSPGGYGQKAQDLQFFIPAEKADNVMVIAQKSSPASYTQTLQLPSGNQMAPDVRFHTGPRVSQCRRSTSCPGPRDSSPSITFPGPPSTPPPEARPETVPLFCPNGSADNTYSRKRTYSKGRHSDRSSTRKTRNKEGIDADDESSLSN